jgi:hypothetical protein
MKVSYFGIGLILIGALIFGAAYAGYPLTIVTVGNSYTVSVPSTVSMPSSTSPSSPTVFASSSYVNLAVEWGTTVTQISGVDASGSGSVEVRITDAAGYAATYIMTNSWKLQYIENYLTKTYFEYFSAQASFNFTNPYPNESVVFTFIFSGFATYGGGTFNYQNVTVYGEFPLQSVQHLGHFYLQIGNNAPVKITNTATQLYYNVTGTSTTFQIWYVEDNGTTTPFTDAYITYQYGSTSSQITLTTTTTLDGYAAYTSNPITIPVPTTLYLQGYVVANGAQGSPYQLMEIGSNMTSASTTTATTTTTTSFGPAQYESMAVGAVLMLIGAVWIFKK